MNPILGETCFDYVGQLLGTGMMQFASAVGIDGLCKESDDGSELNLLAVTARQPGTGQFRTFVEQCKQNYKVIRVLDIWNADLSATLKRYGFTPCKWTDRDETIDGMEWRAN